MGVIIRKTLCKRGSSVFKSVAPRYSLIHGLLKQVEALAHRLKRFSVLI